MSITMMATMSQAFLCLALIFLGQWLRNMTPVMRVGTTLATNLLLITIFVVVGAYPPLPIAGLVVMVLTLALQIFLLVKFGVSMDWNRDPISVHGLIHRLIPDRQRPGDKVIGTIMPYSMHQMRNNHKPVVLTDQFARGGMLISGSTGSGKTFGMEQLIKQDVLSGNNVIYFDYKGDTTVADHMDQFARDHGYRVMRSDLNGVNFSYDPLDSLSPQGRVEALLNVRRWSTNGADEHFKTGTQLFLQQVMSQYQHEGFGYTAGLLQFLKTYHYDQGSRDAYMTVVKLLELVLSSSMRKMYDGTGGEVFSFEHTPGPWMMVMSFTSSTKQLANFTASLMFKDLLDVGTVRPYTPTVSLYVDEFGSSENPFVLKDIMEKGRSAGIAATIALQDVNQVVLHSEMAFLDTILGTINTFVIYNGATRPVAEKFAGVGLQNIENVILALKKPSMGRGGKMNAPTALVISKYPVLGSSYSSEVHRIRPYVVKEKGEGENPRQLSGLTQIMESVRKKSSALTSPVTVIGGQTAQSSPVNPEFGSIADDDASDVCSMTTEEWSELVSGVESGAVPVDWSPCTSSAETEADSTLYDFIEDKNPEQSLCGESNEPSVHADEHSAHGNPQSKHQNGSAAATSKISEPAPNDDWEWFDQLTE